MHDGDDGPSGRCRLGVLGIDAAAATLVQDARASGYRAIGIDIHCGDTAVCADLDVVVVTEGGGTGDDPYGPEHAEAVAAAIGVHLRPGTLVVLLGHRRLRRDGALFASTVELLSGLVAGADYALGCAVGGARKGLTVVAGVDAAARCRTEELFSSLGRETATVSSPGAAELVAKLIGSGVG